jgi:eukaryotic-like serine/threonine-protein kinase
LSVQTIKSGRYRIEDTLGHGGMAVVYVAEDAELGRRVAVKVLAEQFAADDEFRRRFVREARLAARLSHPNVVHVYDAGEDDGHPFIIMELVPGETVADLLKRRRKLPAHEAATLIRQGALGLQHAHEAGLVHRDVKPQNLLLREDGVLKIADFGIARAAESTRLTQLGTVLGTAAYLAPEQALGGEVGPEADIYSLGAVLYEVLTGRPPHEFESLADLAEHHREGAVVPVRDLEPSVPPSLEALVMRCLAREARFRPQSAGEVAAALADDEDNGVTAATRQFPRRISRSVGGRKTWMWIALAVAVAVVALVLGLVGLGGSGKPAPKTPTAARVQPIGQGATAAEEARNLSRWLRSYSRK